jgi:phage tail-like protein
MSIFPLVQPAMKINFFVTMWDTPDSNGGGVGGALSSVGSAVLSVAAAFLAGGFSNVEGLEAVNTLENYKEGGNNTDDLQFFTRATYPKIILKRGVTFNTDIWDWHHQVIAGKRKSRKSGTIILLDHRKLFSIGDETLPFQYVPIASWTFYNALPEKLAAPILDARATGDDTIAIETLELRPEKIERISLSLIPGVADLNSALSGLIGVAGAAATAGLAVGAGAIAAAARG